MTDPLRISAVIPAYNAEAFLKRSVDSALAQTFQPLEIIVVDDGSTDGTAEIAKNYRDAIRYIYQENAGASAARNTAIRAAQGNWIAFLDADDQWQPHHLENAMKILRKHPDLIWYGAPVDQYIHETGKLVAAYKEKKPGLLVDGAYFEDYMSACPPYAFFHTSTMVIRGIVFQQVAFFDERKHFGEDVELFFRIGLCFPKIGYSHTAGANKYERCESLSHRCKMGYKIALATFRERDETASQLGEDVRRRAEPRIVYFFIGLLRSSISEGDCEAVRDILSSHAHRLPWSYRLLGQFFLASPWAFRLAFSIRSVFNVKQRASKFLMIQPKCRLSK